MTNRIDRLFEDIAGLIEQARKRVVTTVNIAEVYTKFRIGQYIVEEEQRGEERAQYGKYILKELSEKLTLKYGKGWGMENLRLIRKFYAVYSTKENQNGVLEIGQGASGESQQAQTPAFSLSWSHYLILMNIANPDERSFYEIEALEQNWSVRQLSRQVGSSLYERLALSRNKAEVMRLAKEGQTIEKPSDIIKNPITLEFLGLQPDKAYSETRLESAIISKM